MGPVPDPSQAVTAGVLLSTLIGLLVYMLKREKSIADETKKEASRVLEDHFATLLELTSEVKQLHASMLDRAERNLNTLAKGNEVVVEAQKLVRELLVVLDRLKGRSNDA